MSKLRLISLGLIAMVLLNIALLTFVSLQHTGKRHKGPPKHDHKRAERLLVDRLGFDEAQADAFRTSKERHKTDVRDGSEALRRHYKALYALLKSDSLDGLARDSTLRLIELAHSDLNRRHLQHFWEVKQLGDTEQQARFDDFVDEMSRRFIPTHEPKGRRKRRK